MDQVVQHLRCRTIGPESPRLYFALNNVSSQRLGTSGAKVIDLAQRGCASISDAAQ